MLSYLLTDQRTVTFGTLNIKLDELHVKSDQLLKSLYSLI